MAQPGYSKLKEKLRPYYLRAYFQLVGRPGEFTDSFKIPTYPLDASSLTEHLDLGLRSPGFLFLPLTNWHTRFQRTQQLACALSEQAAPCFVLNPYVGRQFPTLYSIDGAPRFGRLSSRLAELHIRLRDEPLCHDRLLRPAETNQIADGLRALQGLDLIQVVSIPTFFDVALALRSEFGWPILYDCHDLLSGFAGVARPVVAAENDAMEASNLVVFSSKYLFDEHTKKQPALASKAAIVRNAVDTRCFQPHDRTDRRRNSGGRTVGYIGALEDWFDADLVGLCAETFRNVTFQLIGRVESRQVRKLARLSNVQLLGEIPYQILPNFLQDFDVALIPFRRSPLTLATNPIKMYEYFSSGVPVVSTRLPEIEMHKEIVYLADDAQAFVSSLREALEEDDPRLRQRRIAVAERESWSARARDILDLARHLTGAAAVG